MEKKVRTVCFDCHSKCGVILTVDDNNDIVRVEGDPDCPVNERAVARTTSWIA